MSHPGPHARIIHETKSCDGRTNPRARWTHGKVHCSSICKTVHLRARHMAPCLCIERLQHTYHSEHTKAVRMTNHAVCRCGAGLFPDVCTLARSLQRTRRKHPCCGSWCSFNQMFLMGDRSLELSCRSVQALFRTYDRLASSPNQQSCSWD